MNVDMDKFEEDIAVEDILGDIDIKEAANCEMKNKATDEEIEYLNQHMDEWLDALYTIKKDVESQCTRNHLELEEFRQECFRMGPSGKSRFFEGKAEYDNWNTKTRYFLSKLESKIVIVRQRMKDMGFTDDDNLNVLLKLCNEASTYIDDESWHHRLESVKKRI